MPSIVYCDQTVFTRRPTYSKRDISAGCGHAAVVVKTWRYRTEDGRRVTRCAARCGRHNVEWTDEEIRELGIEVLSTFDVAEWRKQALIRAVELAKERGRNDVRIKAIQAQAREQGRAEEQREATCP